MSNSTKQNIENYGDNARKLAQSYNTVSTPDVVPDFVKVLQGYENPNDLTVLDIGCGTGRDAYWIAEQGFNVIAIDGSKDMLAQAQDIKNHDRIRYIQDTAPDLTKTKNLGQKFDIVLMSAFLFHLDKDERQKFYQNLKNLCQGGTYIHITLRHGPVPEGRRMFEVNPEELKQFAQANNATFVYLGRGEDSLGRQGVSWDYVELKFGA